MERVHPLSIEKRIQDAVEKFYSEYYVGNPVPFWLYIILAGIMIGGSVYIGWQIHNILTPIVESIKTIAPILAMVITFMMFQFMLQPLLTIFTVEEE